MDSINEITITAIADGLKNKTISVSELTEEYIRRIEAVDRGENGLNSVLEINPEAPAIAKRLDESHTERGSRLFGIPILLKDNIDTADSMHTSAGSLALADSVAAADAELVRILRAKGAVLLGKANMTEFANYMTKGMPAGYSSRGGQVKSPYVHEEDPSGSSTGSAVAVTANLCAASIGTDTSDSIVSPGLQNGIVGFRPSMGAISQKGIIPISFTCDTAGLMTRTVMDTILLYSELTGITVKTGEKPDYRGITAGINEWAMKNMKPEEAKKAESIIKELERAGVAIKRLHIEPIPTDNIKTIQRFEFKYAMNRYLSKLPGSFPIRTLKQIIEYNNCHPEQTLKYGQSLLTDAEENTRGNLSEMEYIEMLKDRERHKKEVYTLLRGLDVCIMFMENLLLQYCGLPIITLPHGLYNNGMPYGISMTALTDTGLLTQAYHLERIIGQRVEPKFKKWKEA